MEEAVAVSVCACVGVVRACSTGVCGGARAGGGSGGAWGVGLGGGAGGVAWARVEERRYGRELTNAPLRPAPLAPQLQDWDLSSLLRQCVKRGLPTTSAVSPSSAGLQ